MDIVLFVKAWTPLLMCIVMVIIAVKATWNN
jgi:hypothetical protein